MTALAPLFAALSIAHPGHGEEPTECREIEDLCPLEVGAPHHGEPLDLARMLLFRGRADEAARLVAAEALISAEAAEILADALEALGDPQGASRARERAATIENR